MTANNIMERILEHYWACHNCLTEAGGKPIPKHCYTATQGKCEVCGDEDKTLSPWVDYSWINKSLNTKANRLRD